LFFVAWYGGLHREAARLGGGRFLECDPACSSVVSIPATIPVAPAPMTA